MFARIVTAALPAGAVAGLAAGLLQLTFVQPVLLHAELYESGLLTHFGAAPVGIHPPLPGLQPLRDGLSILFAVLVHAGFALVLVAAMSLAEARGWPVNGRSGILWGLAGFVAVTLAPGLSLPPEVPGMAAAALSARQLWWGFAVISAAAALALIAFGRGPAAWTAAAALLLAPHLAGAPAPATFSGPVPPELAALFTARAFGVALAGWVILGSLAGRLWRRGGAGAGVGVGVGVGKETGEEGGGGAGAA